MIKRRIARRGLTLVELMATLMIFSVVATAAMSMLVSSANTQRYVMKSTNETSQVELAFRRLVENLRSASQAALVSSSEITMVTQPDTTKVGNPVYNVRYVLVGTQLFENDDRFGSNALVSNVTSFQISVAQSTKPTMFQVVLSATTDDGTVITRQAYVTSRNF